METEIIVALIGAGAVVIGAVIAAVSKKKKKKSASDGNRNSTVIGNDNITVIGDRNTITAEAKERTSILAFAAQNVDPNYVLNITGIGKDCYDEGFSMVNVRTLNKGNLDATVTKLKIKIKDYEINTEPHFYFSMYIENGMLIVEILNNGWGTAENYNFYLSLYDNNDYGEPTEITYVSKPQYLSAIVKKLCPGEKKILFKIKSEYFDSKLLRKSVQMKKTSMRDTPFNHILISQNAIDISALVTYWGENKDALQTSNIIIDFDKFGYDAHVLMRSDKFLLDVHPVRYCLGRPDTIYASIIDEQTLEKEYSISRMIKSGEIDDFNIFVGSNKSCTFKIMLSLIYNEGAEVTSSEIPISITRYSNSKTYNKYIDGCEIAIENFRKKNQIRDIFNTWP